MQTFKAVIFDMDGTLIDNDQLWVGANKLFLNKFNIEDSEELAHKMNGRSMPESVQILKKFYNLPHSVEDILSAKVKATDSIYLDCIPFQGVDIFLKKIKERGYKTAIASGSPLERIQKIITRFAWSKYFDALVSTDHVDHVGKPDPAIYLHASEVLGVAPKDCVVFEDSLNGIASAQRAGMFCVAVTCGKVYDVDYSVANAKINSYEEENALKLLNLI